MKRLIFWRVIPLSLLLVFGQGVWGETDFPKPVGPVNDFAGLIPASEKQRMEILGREVLKKTGTSVVVVTIQTIGDSDVATYVNELYQNWGIGKKGEDKGVLIFFALKERRIQIETGYGVEGILPDGRVGEILEGYAVPFLKKDEYGMGLYNALAAVSYVIAKDANVKLSGAVKVYRPSRRRYNESVRLYNTKIRSFPTNIIAGMFGFQRAGLFQAPEAAKEPPKVKF